MDSGGGSVSQELTTQKLKVISSLFELDINASQACSQVSSGLGLACP